MERIIACIAGPSGSGKSFFVANLHNALIYDTDIGGGLAYAADRIKRNKSERVEVSSYLEVEYDLKKRQKDRTLNNFNTLVIDHVTALHQDAQIRHNPNADKDYGRSGEIATREWRRIRNFCRTFDFNLVITAHLKGRWENDKETGQMPDGGKNVEADMSIVLHLKKGDRYPSLAHVHKWRRDPEDSRGLVPATFDLTLENFSKIHGNGAMGAPREAVVMATPEQVASLGKLLEVVKLPDGTPEKWLKKAAVDSFDEMTGDTIQKCIDYAKNLIPKS